MVARLGFTVFLAISLAARAQTPDLTIQCEAEGMYRLRYQDLEPFLKPEKLDLERLVLYLDGKVQPLYVHAATNGVLTRNSGIFFHNPPSRNPASHANAFRMTYDANPPRIRDARPDDIDEEVRVATVRSTFEEDLVYDAWETVDKNILDIPAVERPLWFWRRIAPSNASTDDKAAVPGAQTFALTLGPQPRVIDTTPCYLDIRLRSNLAAATPQEMKVVVSGREVATEKWSGPGMRNVRVSFPGALLRETLTVSIENTSPDKQWVEEKNQVRPNHPNDIFVDSMTLEYPAMLLGPTTEQRQCVFHFETDSLGGKKNYRFGDMSGNGFHVYDIERRFRWTGERATIDAKKSVHLVTVTRDGYFAPRSIRPTSKRRLDKETTGAEWVAIALDRFAPMLRPLSEHRERMGLTTMVVSDHEIYDSFSGGAFSPNAIRRFLEHAAKNWAKKPRYVVLVGDADRGIDWVSQKPVLPTLEVMTYYNGATASDQMYVEGLGIDVAIGRLPVRQDADLVRIMQKIMNYESSPPVGAWRRRMSFIASEGRFGKAVDTLIENQVIRMIESSIPAGYDVDMTYGNLGSPYLYPPSKFNDQVKRRFNDGALFFTYIGHGFKKGFDSLRVGKNFYPILNEKDLVDLDCGDCSPVMAVIACSTAHFDDPADDSIAEGLIRSGKGPVAVYGSTRISHPLPNALIGENLLKSFFASDRAIGDIFNEAKNSLATNWKSSDIVRLGALFVGGLDLERLMHDHVAMYQLFGDPALRVARPRAEIKITAPAKIAPGDEFTVGISSPGITEGRYVVTLECERRQILRAIDKDVDPKDPAQTERVLANYAAANDKVAARAEVDVAGQTAEVKLVCPIDAPPGKYFIKVFGASVKDCGTAGHEIEIAAKP